MASEMSSFYMQFVFLLLLLILSINIAFLHSCQFIVAGYNKTSPARELDTLEAFLVGYLLLLDATIVKPDAFHTFKPLRKIPMPQLPGNECETVNAWYAFVGNGHDAFSFMALTFHLPRFSFRSNASRRSNLLV